MTLQLIGQVGAAALLACWAMCWLAPLWSKGPWRERIYAFVRHTAAGAASAAVVTVTLFGVIMVFGLVYIYARHH